MTNVCRCDRPMPGTDRDCVKCGRPLKALDPKRPKPSQAELRRRQKISEYAQRHRRRQGRT